MHFVLDIDSGTRSSPSPGNCEFTEGGTGIQVCPSCAAFQGDQFQRSENGVSEGQCLLPLWESPISFVDSQVFHNDVLNLLSMEDMWRFRDKPVPLDFDLIQNDQFTLRGQVASAVNPPAGGILRPANGDSGVEGRLNGSVTSYNGNSPTPTPTPKESVANAGHGLKDQRSLSLRENLTLFVSRLV